MTPTERTRARRARLAAAGLTAHGLPRVGVRRVSSWSTARHLPDPRPDGTCGGCLRKLRRYPLGSGWRHYS